MKAVESIEWSTDLNLKQIQDYIDFVYSKGMIGKRYEACSLVVGVRCNGVEG